MEDRKIDKTSVIILAALRVAMAEVGEHRLFKSGKLSGLFASRTGVVGDAASEAIRAGFLEIVRTEEKGKFRIDWVQLTSVGVEYVYRNDSPRAILNEMTDLLRDSRSGVPGWLHEILAQLQKLAKSFSEEMQKYLLRLDSIGRRVEEALRRTEAGVPQLADPLQALVPWGLDLLNYLDRRHSSGATDPCPLPELFAAVHEKHPLLSVPDFHKGLLRLLDNRALTLLPFVGTGYIPQPEHAIPRGAHMLYYAVR